MKQSQIFLINFFKSIIEKITTIKIEYKFDQESLEHCVRVTPKDEYLSNDFNEVENDLLFDFIDNFPEEGLLFITEDSWVNIENPDKIFVGDNFNNDGFSLFEYNNNLEAKKSITIEPKETAYIYDNNNFALAA